MNKLELKSGMNDEKMCYNAVNYETVSYGEKSRVVYHKHSCTKLYWKKYPIELQEIILKYQNLKCNNCNLLIPEQYYSEQMNPREMYMIEEFIEGKTLRTYLDLNKQLEIWEIEPIFYSLVDTLRCLSSADLVHRDIKPENIIINEHTHPILIDFDISRLIDQDKNKKRDTQVLGTPGYSAPEQYGYNQTGTYSDIYSLGSVLQEMLAKLDSKYDDEKIEEYKLFYGTDYEFSPLSNYFYDQLLKTEKLRNLSFKMTNFAYERRPNIDEIHKFCNENLNVKK